VALVPSALMRGRRDGVTFRPLAVDAPSSMTHVDLVAGWTGSRASPVRTAFLATVRQVAAAETRTVSLATE
ncbi:hypothetical protein ACGE32_34960, partial [Klebsiella pneumoniae]